MLDGKISKNTKDCKKNEENQVFEEEDGLFKTEIINKIKHLIKTINEVEDTAIQVKLGIFDYEGMKKKKDCFFKNKLERFKCKKAFIKIFLSEILEPDDLYSEPEDSNIEIIELIFRFKKRYLLNS